MNKLHVGDKIEVLNSGSTYTTYQKLADKLGAINYKFHEAPSEGARGIIVALGEHLDNSDFKIALIQIDGNDYLIGVDGISVTAMGPTSKILDELAEIESRYLNLLKGK